MKKVWNKETRNAEGKFYRSGDWGVTVEDKFDKPNFTDIEPPTDMLKGAPGDFISGEWILDTKSEQYTEYQDMRRQAEYAKAFTEAEFIEAIMEFIAEDRPEKLNAIQAKREAIKLAIPKKVG